MGVIGSVRADDPSRCVRARKVVVTRARPRVCAELECDPGHLQADTLRHGRRELSRRAVWVTLHWKCTAIRRCPFTDRCRLSACRRHPFWFTAGATTARLGWSRRTHFPIPIFLRCRRSFIRQKRIITGARGYRERLDGGPAPSTGSIRIDLVSCQLSVVRVSQLSVVRCQTKRVILVSVQKCTWSRTSLVRRAHVGVMLTDH